MEQVHTPTISAEAKNSAQFNAEATDAEWPRRFCKVERQKSVTHQKKHEETKLQQQHLHTRDDKPQRSHQRLHSVQMVYQTDKTNFELVEFSGDPFDSSRLTTHSF